MTLAVLASVFALQWAIKRIIGPMLGMKSLRCARILLAEIETMHMIRNGQYDRPMWRATSAANQFYSLAW